MMVTHRNLRRKWLAGAAALLLLAACESKEEQAVKFAESGMEYLQEGDLEAAELQFNNALFKDPINIMALRGAAEVAEEKEQIGRQSAMLQRLLNEAPQDVEANLAFARIALLGGQAERALEHAERVLAQRPDDSEALTIKGAALVVDEKLEEATDVLNRALEQDPDNAEIFNLLAAGDIRRDDFEAALKRVNEGIEKAENPETLLIVKLILAERLLGVDDVIATFEALIEAAPENGLYRQRLADYVLQQKRDFDKARGLYLESIPYVTEQIPVFSRVVAIDRAMGGNEKAEDTLKGFIADNPQNEDLRFALPAFYCQTDQIEKCRDAFEALIADESLSEEARLDAKVGLSDVAIARRDLDEAERLVEEVLAEDETNVGALANKGQILLAREEASEAIPVLRNALNNEPGNAEALVFLALAYEATGEDQFANAQFAQAIDVVGYTRQITDQYRNFLKRRGDDERAGEVLERYIDENPSDLEAVLEKAREDVGREDYRGALRASERLSQAGVTSVEARRVTLAALVGLERYEAALPLAKALSEEISDDSNLAALEARILTELDRGGEGIALLEERAAREGATTADFALLSEALIRADRQDEAVDIAAKAVERAPEREDAYIVSYLALKEAGRTEDAIARLETGAQNAETTARARTLLSNELLSAGRMEETLAVLESLAADDSLSPLTANNLASLLLGVEGREAEALAIAERFEGAENPYFVDTLAWAYYKNGQIDKAAPLSRKAAAEAPENVEILYHRGMIALEEGDMGGAESALREAKRLVGTNSQVSPDMIDAALERL